MNTRFLLDEPPICFSPLVAKILGMPDAIVLQQIHFALKTQEPPRVFFQGRQWFQSTDIQWQERLPFLDAGTIQCTLNDLVQKQFLLTFSRADAFAKTVYYTIHYPTLGAYLKKVTHANALAASQRRKIKPSQHSQETLFTLLARVRRNLHPYKPIQGRQTRPRCVQVGCLVLELLEEIILEEVKKLESEENEYRYKEGQEGHLSSQGLNLLGHDPPQPSSWLC